MSPELLNSCVPNLHRRRLVARWDYSEGQGSKVKVTRDKKQHFSALSVACMHFLIGKTSLASGFELDLKTGISVVIEFLPSTLVVEKEQSVRCRCLPVSPDDNF